MGLILLNLILFSVVWFLIWLWFFKGGFSLSSFGKNLKRAIRKDIEKGNYKNAKELLLKSPDLETNLENQQKLGTVHLKLNEYEEAQKCFEGVLKKNPKSFEALMSLAETFKLQGKTDEAFDFYEKASKENVKDINCPLNMGEILYKRGEFEKAVQVLEAAKALSPENVKILFSIAKCKSELCSSDNLDECQQILNDFNALSGQEDLPNDFHIAVAKLYAKTGQIDNAFEFCKNAVENNEENIEAYKLLGLIQLLKKDFAGAKSSLSLALNFQYNNSEIHNIFSYLLCSHEDGCAMQKCRQKYYELVRKHQLNQQLK